MALTQRLELKQSQSLVMTPQLQQAIKLLQLSNIELADYVETELERNPLLERDDVRPEAEAHQNAEAQSGGSEGTLDETLKREDFGPTTDLDAGRDDVYGDAEERPEPRDGATS